MINERRKKHQFAFNMLASYVAMGLSLGLTFFLTPYIVQELGKEAYGYVVLSSNIIGYTSLMTIALNAMAGRFISIKYIEGNIIEANKYFSSVFFSNIILAIVISFSMAFAIMYIDIILDVPVVLINDVKILLALLLISSLLGLITGTFGISTFIKNRIDLASARTVTGNLISTIFIILLFSLFHPHIWYMGLSNCISAMYLAVSNRILLKRLTPDLMLSRMLFDLRKVWDLVTSGMWNILNKLSEILGQGLDLLLANIFIGALAMGTFSITKNVPFLILSLNAAAANVFAPIFTRLYAERKKKELVSELKKSIRILGFISCLLIVNVYVFSYEFYELWLPNQDAHLLQILTILTMVAAPFNLPNEALWNIFTITNRLKYSSLCMLINNALVFIIVLMSMIIVDDSVSKLYVLAGTRAFISIIRGWTFLPIYGAICIGVQKRTFYIPLMKSVLCVFLATMIGYFVKNYLHQENWCQLLVSVIVISIICIMVCYAVVLNKRDKELIIIKVKNILCV